ncbi:MAG TPA: S8 family peptidase [Acidimicrobiia bacterium]|nr:S8 family peptidase [Acidimicrobiia bacterium]
MRRSSVVLVALLAALALTVPAGANLAYQVAGDQAPYVVIMADDPVVAYQGDVPGIPATAPGPGEKVDPDSPAVRNYQRHLEEQRGNAQAKAGVAESQVLTSYDFALSGFAALLTLDEAERLRGQKNVLAVIEDELHQIHTDASGDFLGLTDPGGAYDTGLTGEGVIVGVIDTGIWPEHPSFADDGSYSDPGIDVPCEFGNTEHNPDDLAFSCNNKLLGARDMRTLYNAIIGPELYDSARDADGHGSHTASTAAGNAGVSAEIFGVPRGTISGIAPRAQIIAYKGCGDLGCFGGDLADAIDQAVADGVEVINYSIGSNTPSLDGADSIAFLFASALGGVHVSTSAGNAGPGASTVGSPAASPWVLSVGASHHDRMFQGTVTLGDGSSFTGASVTLGVDEETELVDAADLRNELCDPEVNFRPSPRNKIVLCKGAVGRAAKSRAVLEAGGVGMVLYNDFAHQTLPSDNHFLPTVHVTNADGLAIKAYIADTVAAPGNDRPTATIAGGEAVDREGSFMAYFSSRGPVGSPGSADIVKPDVTAPGVQILAANSPAPGFDAAGELFQAIQGTSMSSPHGAGLLALIDQAHPEWTPAMVKSALMTTARQDVFKQDQTTPADPFDMGAGHVDPGGGATTANSMFNPGVVYDAGFNEYLGFLCDAAPQVFANPAGTCGSLEANGIPTEAQNLNYPSIGAAEVPGTLTVQRSLTNVTRSALQVAATAEEPNGFDVTVSPSSLVIPPGQSRSFEITFTNVAAPIGEFRFGSLTWAGDGFEARSPIAVKAAAFDAPESVSGTGVDGSASFDIRFGYSGEYDAAAHGLAANQPITGTVTQDADQTFDPADAGNGATAHVIEVSDSVFLRIAVTTEDLTPPDPAIDLDLYLYKDGAEVALSGAPSTDEIIELVAPEDGTYTLFVHGWQTTGIEVGYSINTWTVPGEMDTGSLQVTAEPEDATANTTGTITVGWSGLDAGAEYVGAVSHHDADGQLGVTLVEVSTE